MWNKYMHNPRYGRLTKEDALRDFRENIKPSVDAQYGRGDRVALAEAWSGYVDMLERDGMITRWQADNWTNPY